MFWRKGMVKFAGIGLIVLLVAAAGLSTRVLALGGPDHEDAVEAFERDVYVIVGSTLRNPTDETDASAPLFNEAGVWLEVTWGEWQQANATAVARVQGGANHPRTDVRIHLTGLIPGGVYSIYYGTIIPDSENPLCPDVERTLPLIAASIDQPQVDIASFVAGADGTATYRGQAEGNLLSPLQSFYSVVYHSDGQTYDPLPNHGEFLTQGAGCHSSFGQDAMRQLIIFQKFS